MKTKIWKNNVIVYLCIFFIINSFSNAYTKREKINIELSKLGVSQDIIKETELAYFEITQLLDIPDDEKIKIYEKILEKDGKNHIIRDELIVLYLMYKNDFIKSKQLLDENAKYYNDPEALISYFLYYKRLGSTVDAEKYKNELKRLYGHTPFVYITDMDILENKRKLDKLIKYISSEENKRKYSIEDEVVYFYQLHRNITEVKELIDKNKYEESTNLFIKKIMDDPSLTRDIVVINKEIFLSSTFILQTAMSKLDENKQKQYIKIIENSKLTLLVRSIWANNVG